MNRNAIEILKKQVENRQNYLQNTLEETQNLSSLAGTINIAVENQTAVENISVEAVSYTHLDVYKRQVRVRSSAFNFIIIAGWSSLEARRAHNPKVTGSNPVPAIYAQIAQLVEQRTENPRVAGSIPALGIFLVIKRNIIE